MEILTSSYFHSPPNLAFTGYPPETERNSFYKEFTKFGKIVKLYLEPGGTFGKVYFADSSCHNEVVRNLSGISPLNLIFLPVAPDSREGYRRFESGGSTSNLSVDMRNFEEENENDVITEFGPEYVDLFGHTINTLTAETGETFVPLDDVLRGGYTLFKADTYPHDLKLNYDEEIIKQFEYYMLTKAKKFVFQNSISISEGTVKKTIERCKLKSFHMPQNGLLPDNNRAVLNDRTSPAHVNFAQSNRYPHHRNSHSARFDLQQAPRDRSVGRGSAAAQYDNETESKPLRRPNASESSLKQNVVTNSQSFSKRGNQNRDNHRQSMGRDSRPSSSPQDVRNKLNQGSLNENNDKPEGALQNTPFRNIQPKLSPGTTGQSSSAQNSIMAPLTKASLVMNSFHKVTVVYVESETIGWVQQDANEKVIDDILYRTVTEAANSKAVQPVINKVCAAMFNNGSWFRALTLSTHPCINVQYIDYGNINTDTIQEVRSLSDQLCGIPAQAVRIRLEFGGQQVLENNKKLDIKPILEESDGTYLVQLKRPGSSQSNHSLPSTSHSESHVVNSNLLPDELPTDSPQSSKDETAPTKKSDSYAELKQQTVIIPVTQKESPPESVTSHFVVKSDRKSVIEKVGEEGIFECTDIVNENTFIAIGLIPTLEKELNLLDKMSEEISGPDNNYRPDIGESVAVQKDGAWVRGTVINIKDEEYVTALVDFGVITTERDVRRLPEKFLHIPEFAFVCTCDSSRMHLVKNAKDIMLHVLPNSKLSLEIIYGPRVEVVAEKWDPFQTSLLAAKPGTEQVVYNTYPAIPSVKNGDVVIIEAEIDGMLCIRTKSCNDALKEIKEELKSYEASPLKSMPELDQLVICPFESDELFRAAVKNVDGNNVVVSYLDYGNSDIVPMEKLRNINEKLAKMPISVIKVVLKNFANKRFPMEALLVLSSYEKSREKFRVVRDETSAEVDLKQANGNLLSEVLLNLDKAQDSSEILYSDLKTNHLSPGNHSLMAVFVESLDEAAVTFSFSGDNTVMSFTGLNSMIESYIATNPQPYRPKKECEICIAKYEGWWYRATVLTISENSNKYGVYFLDFGNAAEVASDDIRRIPKDCIEMQPAAIICMLQDLVDITANEIRVPEPLLARLKELIVEGSRYDVNVIANKGNQTFITIPSVYAKLRNENLI